jgi:hypothetical protein
MNVKKQQREKNSFASLITFRGVMLTAKLKFINSHLRMCSDAVVAERESAIKKNWKIIAHTKSFLFSVSDK